VNSPSIVVVTLTVMRPPVIQAVTDSWNYAAGVAPGAWVTIVGTALAAGGAQTWNLTGTQLPTSLSGVTVTFNGTQAALLYVSATQINALVPASVAPGLVRSSWSRTAEQRSVRGKGRAHPARSVCAAERGWQHVLRDGGTGWYSGTDRQQRY